MKATEFKVKYWMCAMTALVMVWLIMATFLGADFQTHSGKLLAVWLMVSLLMAAFVQRMLTDQK
jgi:uncharacterized membrane protein YdjX (TVP38/TMEM64 family)